MYGTLQTNPPGLKPQPGSVLLAPRLMALLNLKIGDSIDGLKDMMSDTVRTVKSKIDRIIADSEDKLDELKKKSQALTEDLLKESTEKIDDVKKMINKELKKKK